MAHQSFICCSRKIELISIIFILSKSSFLSTKKFFIIVIQRKLIFKYNSKINAIDIKINKNSHICSIAIKIFVLPRTRFSSIGSFDFNIKSINFHIIMNVITLCINIRIIFFN